MRNRCLLCWEEFDADSHVIKLCPECDDRERREFAEVRGLELDTTPVPHTKTWYQERLGVSGTRDE